MNIEATLERIKEISREITVLNAESLSLKQEVAEHKCPFKVGQRVISPEGEEQIVAKIGFYPSAMYEFKVYRLKKDGTPRKDMCHAYKPWGYKAAHDVEEVCR